jgi:hypothetical protein
MNDLDTRPKARHSQDERLPRAAFEHATGTVCELDADGWLWVDTVGGRPLRCEWLQGPSGSVPSIGERVLLLIAAEASVPGIVLGRVGPVPAAPAEGSCSAHVRLVATESLSLQCGAASIELRADGKVMVRGEDVLLRAKGTQRIRAGTVSIN